ncbi:MAG: hypothetical protein U1E30_09605 [Rhodoblastus sp.]
MPQILLRFTRKCRTAFVGLTRPQPLLRASLAAALFCAAAPARAVDTGLVASWGRNTDGEIGDGTSTQRTSPVAIGVTPFGNASVIQVAGGVNHSCALDVNGRVWCWGLGNNGQLGDNTGVQRLTPTAVLSSGALAGKSVVQIAAGQAHTCAMTADGGVYCWGYNFYGQLGDGTSFQRNAPVAVSTSGALAGKKVVQITAGVYHTCALTSDGKAYCWGDNSNGALGDNTGTQRFVPTAVSTSGVLSGKTVTQISGGGYHTCALTSDGGLYCWGSNSGGELGDGGTLLRNAPVAVVTSGALAGKTPVQISAGGYHSCALVSSGSAYCWGANSFGGLGDGTTTQRLTPVAVSTSGALTGKTIVQISANFDFTCALTSDGRVYCWGYNGYGNLGDGTTTTRTLPTAVSTSGALSGQFLTNISAGYYFVTTTASPCGAGAPISTGSGASALWTRVALPCNNFMNATARVQDILGSSGLSKNLLNPNTYGGSGGTGWAVYRHDAATNAYVMLALTDTLDRGTGYWIKSYETPYLNKLVVPGVNQTVTPITAPVTQAQGCASANGCFAISVTAVAGQSRYNLLGNPFPWAVDWSQARVRVDGSASTYTPSQAAAANVLAATFWTWNGTSYDVYSDTAPNIGNLPYFGSFWVQALAGGAGHTVELLVPKLATTLP